MNNLDLNAMGVKEMNEKEMKTKNGGYAPDDGGCISFPILFPFPIKKTGFPDILTSYDPIR